MGGAHDTADSDGRAFGWGIAIASAIAVGAMMMHPSTSAGSLDEALREIGRESGVNRVVHGFLMILTSVLVWGFAGFAVRLRARRLALAGFVAWAIGAVAMLCAAVASGFIVPALASAYVNSTPEQIEGVRGLLRLTGAFNQAWALVGAVAQAAAIALWSVALARQGVRVIGWCGIAGGGAAAIAVGSGALPLHVHGMLAIVVAQALWSVAVAAQLIRHRI